MQKQVYINKIGEVTFKKDRRFKRLSMRLSEDGQLTVNRPYNIAMHTAQKWVEDQVEWISKSRNKLKERESKKSIFTIGSQYQTYKHTIHIVEGKSSSKGNILNIGVPPEILQNIERKETQDAFRAIINNVYAKEAKEELPIRVCELANKHHFSFNKLSFRNNKSRWGSCSSDKNISLNVHLMRLPDKLIDYIILHELCHTIEMNHSAAFWKLLEKVCPESEQYKKEIKKYSTTEY